MSSWETEVSARAAGAAAAQGTDAAVACDAANAVHAAIEAGQGRAGIIGAARIAADAPVVTAFEADVSVMSPVKKGLAYAMIRAWWDGACDAAREAWGEALLASPPPVVQPEPVAVQPEPVVEPAPVAVEPAPVAVEPAPVVEEGSVPTRATTTGDQLEDAKEVAIRSLPANVSDAYRDCLWMVVTTSRLGTTRQADVTVTTDAGADATETTTTSKSILRGCPEINAIVAADTSFRAKLKSLGLPSFLRGAYPVPPQNWERVNDAVEAYEIERPKLVEALIQAWDGAVLRDRNTMPEGLWDPDDYPSKAYVRRSYRFAAVWRNLADATKDLPAALAARNARAQEQLQREAFAEIRAAMRVGLAGMVDQLTNALRPDPVTGQLPRFTDNRVTSIREFLSDLPALDVTGDTELRRVADQAKGLLDGITDVETLRRDTGFRAAMATKFEAVRGELATLGVTMVVPKNRAAKRREKKAA